MSTTFNKSGAIKIATVFITLFTLCCVKLCAQEISTEKAASLRQNMVNEAKTLVGSPYVLGAVGPDSFDCSGLVYYVAREAANKQLPRTSKALYSSSTKVSEADKEAGDLVFFGTNGIINHVGLYIGNNQFISAVSDGPNTGVILSSLAENYWKTHYMGAGRFLPSGIKKSKPAKTADANISTNSTSTVVSSSKNNSKTDTKKESSGSVFKDFLEDVSVDFSALVDWAFVLPNDFIPNYRGIDLAAGATYNALDIAPGLGIALRFNNALRIFQMPLTASLNFNDYIKFYAGPVISMGTPKPFFEKPVLDDNGKPVDSKPDVSPSFFPGVIGLSFSTPDLTKADWKLQLVHDMSLTVYNKPDGSALSIAKSLCLGFVMYTGVKVVLPLNMFM